VKVAKVRAAAVAAANDAARPPATVNLCALRIPRRQNNYCHHPMQNGSRRTIIELQSVEKTYFLEGDNKVHALRGVDLKIGEGSFVAIMGPSGSGKSTMLNLLGCLDRPTAGHYLLGGIDISRMNDDELSRVRGQQVGFIFQSYNLIAQLTVIENIQVPLIYQGKNPLQCYDHCVKLANLVGLGDRLTHRPSQLSGGQQQRVAIARSLVNNPLMILADEPTGNLDSKTGAEVLEMIDRLNASGTTIVLVTHDDKVAARAQRVIHMKDGVIDRDISNRAAKDDLHESPLTV
jgi:putative ABC transport system ATP-binding protein